jgi:hypothetical protein
MSDTPALPEPDFRALLAYDPETGAITNLTQRRPQAPVGSVAGYIEDGYRRIKIDGRTYSAHRLAWWFVYGSWPAYEIDHRNGIRDDNRIANLREAVPPLLNQQNIRSPRSDNTSGFLGVRWHQQSGKWRAEIRIGRAKRHLGLFSTPEAAHNAYLAAKREHHLGCTI